MPRFRLLMGRHIEAKRDAKGNIMHGKPTGQNPKGAKLTVSYNRGDVFDSPNDLDLMFNQPGSAKFERVVDAHQEVWDRNKETLAQFTKRMEGKESQQPATGTEPETTPVGEAAKAGFNTAFTDLYGSMTVAELKKHAEEEEIDLRGATKREEILKAIQAALAEA